MEKGVSTQKEQRLKRQKQIKKNYDVWRTHCKRYGLAFDITAEEWLAVWRNSEDCDHYGHIAKINKDADWSATNIRYRTAPIRARRGQSKWNVRNLTVAQWIAELRARA